MPDIIAPIINLLQAPPIGNLHIFPTAPNLIGEGDLPAYSDPVGQFPYGVFFSAVHIPPELGRAAGTPATYFDPLVTLWFFKSTAGGIEVLTEAVQLHTAEAYHEYLGLGVVRVHYWILPGVELAWGYVA